MSVLVGGSSGMRTCYSHSIGVFPLSFMLVKRRCVTGLRETTKLQSGPLVTDGFG